MDEKLGYTKKVVVSVHDTGVMGELKPSAILQYFQDAATEHAALLSLSRFELWPMGLYWVVTRVSAAITREILIGENLSVFTYPLPPKAASANRDYLVYDESGNIVIRGASKWCVLDTKTHMPRRITPLFPFPVEDYKQDYAMGKEAEVIPQLDVTGLDFKTFEVRNSELDTNFHMNNARYGDMIYNVVDPRIFTNAFISGFHSDFIHELKAGEKYSVYYKTDDGINIEVRSDGKECFRARATLSRK